MYIILYVQYLSSILTHYMNKCITHIKKHVHVHVLRRSINMNVISRYSVINLISNKKTNTVILP